MARSAVDKLFRIVKFSYDVLKMGQCDILAWSYMEKSKKILYIFEDDPRFRSSYVSLVEKIGWQVFAFESPRECSKDFFSQHPPTAISLDIAMPGKNGLDFAEELAHTAETSGVPIFFVTSMKDAEHESRAASLAAKAYFVKFETSLQDIVTWISAETF